MTWDYPWGSSDGYAPPDGDIPASDVCHSQWVARQGDDRLWEWTKAGPFTDDFVEYTFTCPIEVPYQRLRLYRHWKAPHNKFVYKFIEGVDAALEEEEEETPPPKQKPSKSPSQATKVLKTLRVSPEAKDDMRVRTILSKPDPAKEAKIQARKILNLGKALRRAKAAFNIHVVTKSPEALEVAQIFVEQAMSLGWTP